MAERQADAVLVTVNEFVRAESDRDFREAVNRNGLGALHHTRALTPVDEQGVVRMNRDTLYSSGVFDLDAAPVTVRLPDAGARFMSLLPIRQDHYTPGCVYEPGPHTFTRDAIGTRYVSLVVRTFVDPDDPADFDAVHAVQDAISAEQDQVGTFEVPNRDPVTLTVVRDTLVRVAPALLGTPGGSFCRPEEVDPIRHLLATAGGWGGKPERDAMYVSVFPERNDGITAYQLTVCDVPVDGFWSVSVYDEARLFAPNAEQRYSLNNVTAVADADDSVTIRFGGTDPTAPNRLPIIAGWN